MYIYIFYIYIYAFYIYIYIVINLFLFWATDRARLDSGKRTKNKWPYQISCSNVFKYTDGSIESHRSIYIVKHTRITNFNFKCSPLFKQIHLFENKKRVRETVIVWLFLWCYWYYISWLTFFIRGHSPALLCFLFPQHMLNLTIPENHVKTKVWHPIFD